MTKLYYSVKEYNELKLEHDNLKDKIASLQVELDEATAKLEGSEISVDSQLIIQDLNAQIESLSQSLNEANSEIEALKKATPSSTRVVAKSETNAEEEEIEENPVKKVGASLFQIVKSSNIV